MNPFFAFPLQDATLTVTVDWTQQASFDKWNMLDMVYVTAEVWASKIVRLPYS